MRTQAIWFLVLAGVGFGCGKAPAPDRVELALAPDLISSKGATLNAIATVFDGDTVLSDWAVHLTVDYADRNGTAHVISDAVASANTGGEVSASLPGFGWQGAGTITATVLDDKGDAVLDAKKAPVVTKASFGVIDETAPVVTITSPSAGVHVPRGQYSVTVNAADEIGVSQVYIQAVNQGGGSGGGGGNNGQNSDRTRSTILASGTTSGTVTLGFSTEGAQVGDTVKIYAMAADMSGNLAVASSISIVVDPPLP